MVGSSAYGASISSPEIHCDSVPSIRIRPPRGSAGVHGHRQVLALVLEPHAHPLQRPQQRPDRAPAEVALADEPHRAVAERGEPEQEVQRRARAAHRNLVADRRELPAGHAPPGAGVLDLRPERAQGPDRERDVAGRRALDDRALPRGERREHQRAMGVVLRRRDRQLPHERSLGFGYQQAHRRQDNGAFTRHSPPPEIDPPNGGSAARAPAVRLRASIAVRPRASTWARLRAATAATVRGRPDTAPTT